MATALISKGHVTCLICTQVYQDPYALKCLHSFCLECVKQIKPDQHSSTSKSISCPTCHYLTNINSIKKDFKTQGFVDLYNEQRAMFNARRVDRKSARQKSLKKVSLSTGKCEACGTANKSIKSKCVQCKQMMCEECAITHRGIPACQNHDVLPIKDVVKDIQSGLRKTVAELVNDKENLVKKSREIKECVTDMQNCHTRQISEVNKQIDQIITELERYRKNLNEIVNRENHSFIDNLKSGSHVYEANQYDIQGDVDFLTDLIESSDLPTLTESAKSIDTSIKYDNKKLRESLPDIDSDITLPVILVMGSVFDPSVFIRLQVNESKVSFTKMAQSLINECQSRSSPDNNKHGLDGSKPKTISADKMVANTPRERPGDTTRKSHGDKVHTSINKQWKILTPGASKSAENLDRIRVTPNQFQTATEVKSKVHLPVKVGQSTFIKPAAKETKSTPPRPVTSKRPLHEARSLPLETKMDARKDNDNANYFRPSIDSVFTPPKYAQVINFTYKYEKNIALTFYPQRLCVVKSNVWIAGWDGVYVFDKHGQPIKSILHPKLQFVRGIVQTHNDDIIVACAGNKGLFKLDISGKFKDRVGYGSYTDVCTYNKRVYALDNEIFKVLVFELKGKTWKLIREFNNIKNCERICVNVDIMFLSSREHHKLFLYNLDGRLLYSAGENGSRKPGKLKHPLLCDVNNAGDALIADCDNHRLQVRYQDGGYWRVLTLPGDLRWPVDGVVDQKASVIWIIKHEPSMLLKFSRKHASMNDLLDITF